MDTGDSRRLPAPARASLLASLALAAGSMAASGAAIVLGLTTGTYYAPGGATFRAIGFWTALGACAVAGVATLLLWQAHRRDPAGPAGRDVRALRLASPPPTVELGETGLRFPWALLVSVASSTLGVAFLSAVFHDPPSGVWYAALAVLGVSLAAIPIALGVAWWPVLVRAVLGGITARQLRLIGLVYLVVGAVSGVGGALLAAVLSGGDLAPAGGLVGLGGLLAWRGGVLVSFAARARRAGLAPSPVVATRPGGARSAAVSRRSGPRPRPHHRSGRARPGR